jgi:acetyl esterase/lipase
VGSSSPYPNEERPSAYSRDKAGSPIRQPTTYEARLQLARQTVAESGIKVPVLVDEMDNPVWCTYGPAPNIAYFIDRGGTVLVKQSWYQPSAMEDFIKKYLGLDAPPPPATRPVPTTTRVQILKDIEYGRGGGFPLYLDVYVPEDPIMKPMPAVVFIHGGGWRSGDKYPSQVRSLAERGFFAVSINYRLSGVATFPAAVEDSKCAVRWLRANAGKYGVDPNRIGVWGGSAGGHLAMMVACADETAGMEGNGGWETYSSRVEAVCSYYGPADLSRMQDGDTVAPAQFLGGSPAQRPEAYRAASPVTYVTADDPPLLMVHGESDRVVPYGQSVAMEEAYLKLGLKVELVKVLNAGHGFQQVGTGAVSPAANEIFLEVLGFFARELCCP